MVPVDGVYRLETWVASGGNATGEIELKADDMLYIYVGGQGNNIEPKCIEKKAGNGYARITLIKKL